ncbi:MAG: lipoate--protein ligase [Clostridia bacterium]|nr:lipoate--protein ligase [Clostridia bacterium]
MITALKIFISPSTDVFFNQGVELDLFDNVCDGEYLLYLWVNDGAVVIGRNQRAEAEVNLDLLQRDGKALARRLSGGGAVYHDKGNLNFTFISKSKDFDLSANRRIVLGALSDLGYNAELTGRNDFEVDGHKISGNAYYKRDDKEFHHGTILVESKAEDVAMYLTPSIDKFKGKAVGSVQSRVRSLADVKPVSIDQVICALTRRFQAEFGVKCEAEITCTSKNKEFFEDGTWRFGTQTKQDKDVKIDFNDSKVILHISLDKGRIVGCQCESDSLDNEIDIKISKEILGKNLDTDSGTLLDRIKEEIYGI